MIMKLSLLILVIGFISLAADGAVSASLSLAERLGYQANDRLLIINGDDAGMCHTANLATIEALETGLMTTATLMVPCPWFGEMAEYVRQHPDKDFGIHLCHTAEWRHYRWGPIAGREQVPGLVDAEGCLWRSVEEVYAHSNPDEAWREARAQILKAKAAGVEPTHLDSHMGTLQYDARYMESYLKLAREFDLPVRMASQSTLIKFQQPELRAKFAAQGILFPDFFIHEELSAESKDVKAFWLSILKHLKPGVTELYIHAGKATDELKAITGSWATRSAEFEAFAKDDDVRQAISDNKIIRIGYRPLLKLQHQERNNSKSN
jgi:chitin disaccharide deacetylase